MNKCVDLDTKVPQRALMTGTTLLLTLEESNTVATIPYLILKVRLQH